MTAQVITLTPQEAERVTLRREWKSRKHLDKGHVAWLCEDKLRQTLVLSGKLAMCADFINSITQDKCDKVSVAGLYEAACYHNESARTAGWHKMRWKIHPVPLDDIRAVLARLSADHERSAIIASPGVCSVA